MTNYLWVIVLSILSLVSLLIFLISFSKDHMLIKRLKKGSINYVPNFLLLLFSIVDIGLVIYLFKMLKDQIGVLG